MIVHDQAIKTLSLHLVQGLPFIFQPNIAVIGAFELDVNQILFDLTSQVTPLIRHIAKHT